MDQKTFKAKSNIKWYRCKIDPEKLNVLMRRSNLQGLRQVGGLLLLCACTGIISYIIFSLLNGTSWYWCLPCLLLSFFLHGSVCHFLGGVSCHELLHRTPFKSKRLNELFLRIFAFLSWTDFIGFRASHIKHHQATVHTDHDGEIRLPFQLITKPQILFWMEKFAWNPVFTWVAIKSYFYWSFGKLDFNLPQGSAWYNFILPTSNKELRQQHKRWARTVLLGHAILTTIFLITGNWVLIVLINGVHYCKWLGWLFESPQHYGLSPNTSDFRLSVRTYTCSRLVAFLYWNMQYHLEHHMFPAVPFYNLPQLRQAIAHDLPLAHHGLRPTWNEIWDIHHRQTNDSNYTFVPKIPIANKKDTGVKTDDVILQQEATLA